MLGLPACVVYRSPRPSSSVACHRGRTTTTVAVSSPASAHGGYDEVDVQSSVSDFLTFYETFKSASIDTKIENWETVYVSKYASQFQRILYKRGEKRLVLESAFSRFPDVVPFLTTVEPRLPAITNETLSKLHRIFPDTYVKLDVIYLVCDFGFGGMLGQVDNRLTLVQCLEQHPSVESLSSELRHELFHAFHATVNPGIIDDGRVAAMLLVEGLATLDSLRSAPGQDIVQVIFGDSPPTNWQQRMIAEWSRVIQQIIVDLERTDRSARVRWLGFSPRTDFVPEASAYFVGARVAEMLIDSIGFEAVIRLEEETLTEHVEDALKSVSHGL
jgi:hypothetical protein